MVARPWTIHGPFPLDKHSSSTWKELLRDEVKKHLGLNEAIGVYVIAVSNRGNDRIRYIGMTYAQGFEAEIFSPRNVRDVWDVLQIEKSQTLNIWLFAKPNVSRVGYSTDSGLYRQAHLLEELLIMHAKAAGHKLINTKKMKSAEGIAVKGLFGVRARGARSKAALTISKALALN
jgi:hypothetical protein